MLIKQLRKRWNKYCYENKPHIYEDILKKVFVDAFNSLLENKAEILQGYETIIQTLIDTSKLDRESEKLQSEIGIVAEMLRKCVEENAHSTLDKQNIKNVTVAWLNDMKV